MAFKRKRLMPVDYKRYPKSWKRISLLIRMRRAQGRCEWCQAENGKPHPKTGSRVVLTVAHLGEPFALNGDKHDKMDIRSENLAALCNLCHLRYDHSDHIRNAKATRQKRRLEREPLLFEG
jgi:hypothetical protein